MGRELAEQHAAGRFEPLGDGGVPACNVVDQDLRMRRGRQTFNIYDVLQSIRYAVKRSAPATCCNFLFGRLVC